MAVRNRFLGFRIVLVLVLLLDLEGRQNKEQDFRQNRLAYLFALCFPAPVSAGMITLRIMTSPGMEQWLGAALFQFP